MRTGDRCTTDLGDVVDAVVGRRRPSSRAGTGNSSPRTARLRGRAGGGDDDIGFIDFQLGSQTRARSSGSWLSKALEARGPDCPAASTAGLPGTGIERQAKNQRHGAPAPSPPTRARCTFRGLRRSATSPPRRPSLPTTSRIPANAPSPAPSCSASPTAPTTKSTASGPGPEGLATGVPRRGAVQGRLRLEVAAQRGPAPAHRSFGKI